MEVLWHNRYLISTASFFFLTFACTGIGVYKVNGGLKSPRRRYFNLQHNCYATISNTPVSLEKLNEWYLYEIWHCIHQCDQWCRETKPFSSSPLRSAHYMMNYLSLRSLLLFFQLTCTMYMLFIGALDRNWFEEICTSFSRTSWTKHDIIYTCTVLGHMHYIQWSTDPDKCDFGLSQYINP